MYISHNKFRRNYRTMFMSMRYRTEVSIVDVDFSSGMLLDQPNDARNKYRMIYHLATIYQTLSSVLV